MNNKLIKLIALDLDGTLLDNNGEIHPENLKIIKKIHEECPDIKIVIATGTGPVRAKQYAEQCQSEYVICYNGGAIINILEEKMEVVIKKVISIEQFEEILTIAKEYRVEELQIYDQDHNRILGLEKVKNVLQEKINEKQENNGNYFLYKGLLFFSYDDEKINNIIEQLIEKYPNFQISRSKLSKTHPYFKINPNGIDINSQGVNKGEALAILCKKLNLNSEQVFACGDEMNDKTMLEFAGYSVAMGNANSELKAIAKFKTETNEKAGVAKSIEKIIFSQEQITINEKQIFWSEFNVLAQNYENLFPDLCNIPLQFKI